MSFKLSTKIGGLAALLIAAIIVVGGVGYFGIQSLDASMDNIAKVQMPAVHNLVLADMMHDGVRAVVFRSILAAEARNADEMTASGEEFKEFSDNFRKYLETLDSLPLHKETKDAIAAAKPQLDAYLAGAEKIVRFAESGRVDEAKAGLAEFGALFKKLEGDMAKLGELIEEDAKEAQEEGDRAADQAKSVSLMVILAAAILGAVVGIFLTMNITRSLQTIFKGLKTFSTAELNETGETFKRIIEGLNAGADQVASASEQVSSSSQNVAEAGAENASSLEETSSSIEEITSMIQQTADNAGQARGLTKEAGEIVTRANTSMIDMQKGMGEIKTNSDEIAKIIKVIEEIAFQTNLLALNAAVEAARAGEHGKGFAVVAEEVRNLAQRAAASAKDTSALIEKAVANVNNGMKQVSDVAEAMKGVTASAGKVGNLVEEIANASREQSQGINQVNSAIGQMDKVTQSVAANAEEAAAAAEEMSSQAVAVRENVQQLVLLIEGTTRDPGGAHRATHPATPDRNIGNVETRRPAAQRRRKPDPESVIPLKDQDFKEF